MTDRNCRVASDDPQHVVANASRNWRHPLIIALAASLVYFANLGATAVFDMDEAIYSACAREMLERGDWVTPMYNGDLFPEKPPLMFWTMMAGFSIFGVNEFAVRFFSALAGVATALLTYYLGRRLFSERAAFWGGMTLVLTMLFGISARAATVDAVLTLLTTLVFTLLARGGIARRPLVSTAGDDASRPPTPDLATPMDYVPRSRWVWLAIWCCLAICVLAKGPIGLLLPAAAIGLFLMIMNSSASHSPSNTAGIWRRAAMAIVRCATPMNFWRSLLQMRPLLGAAVVCAIALPWYLWVHVRTDGEWFRLFMAESNVGPFAEPIKGHSGPPWYYIVVVLVGFFPASLYFAPMALDVLRRLRHDNPWRRAYILLACWFVMWMLFWTICATKLPHYVLPAAPAFALFTGCFLDGWLTHPIASGRWWPRVATGVLLVVAIGFTLVFPMVAAVYAPGDEWLGLIGLMLLPGAGLFFWWTEQGRPQRALAAVTVTGVLLLTTVFGFAARQIDRHQVARPMLSAVRADAARHGIETPHWAAYKYLRWSTVFYAGRNIPMVADLSPARTAALGTESPDAPVADVSSTGPVYLFTHERHRAEIEATFPNQYEVLYRQREFLTEADDGEVIVLADRQRGNLH